MSGERVLSHESPSSWVDLEKASQRAGEIKTRLRSLTTTVLPLEEELAIVDQLLEFDFGRYLLVNRGLNGYWTDYIFHFDKSQSCTDLERWLLSKSLYQTIRERFERMKTLVASYITPGGRYLSVPCGLMGDLLEQDPALLRTGEIIGVDVDTESLSLARERADSARVLDQTLLIRGDAWALDVRDVTLLVSNGLNMYETDRTRLVELYRGFGSALSDAGVAVVSFIPPPPSMSCDSPNDSSPWELVGLSQSDLLLDSAISQDILQVKYANYVEPEEFERQMGEAELAVLDIHYNSFGTLPVAILCRADSISSGMSRRKVNR